MLPYLSLAKSGAPLIAPSIPENEASSLYAGPVFKLEQNLGLILSPSEESKA